jgi:hypothetical protein
MGLWRRVRHDKRFRTPPLDNESTPLLDGVSYCCFARD